MREQADLRLLRDGKEQTVQVQLVQPKRLIPHHIHGRPPPYYIIAGFVFTQVPAELTCLPRVLPASYACCACRLWSLSRSMPSSLIVERPRAPVQYFTAACRTAESLQGMS